MLTDTLTKIKAKIEAANENWSKENEVKMIQGYEMIANRGGQNWKRQANINCKLRNLCVKKKK